MKSPNTNSPELTICPCCGARDCGDLSVSPCAGCGAFSVGPALPRPERELPAYGLPFAVGGAGFLLAAVFLAAAAFALFERKPFALDFWSLVGAGETAAWRLKWVVLPLALLAAYFGERALRRIAVDPRRFSLVRFARAGYASSALVAFALVALVGMTLPERLRQREVAQTAAEYADAYEPARVLLDYQQQYGTLPASAEDLRKLPDPDGSVARAAAMLAAGEYEPESTIASLPARSGRGRRAANVAIRKVSLRADADGPAGEPITFTNYTLRLPGRDRKLGTSDDLLVRDGMIVPVPAPAEPAARAARPVSKP